MQKLHPLGHTSRSHNLIHPLQSYDDVAFEYYDSEAHPTCANFRSASVLLLTNWISDILKIENWICEIGPGCSVVAELMASQKTSMDRCVLFDSSRTMLKYSSKWFASGIHPVVAQAENLPTRECAFDIIVASLGDPYNTPTFWKESQRVLRPGGRLFYTTPSHEWAHAFREGEADDSFYSAEFLMRDGTIINVPSFIYQDHQQRRMITNAGFKVIQIGKVHLDDISGENISHKLKMDGNAKTAIVTGYVVQKNQTDTVT